MKNVKIVLVAEWDGWCGACAAERPLVLTRTGRQRLRTWLSGAADDSRPLVLTCRLCGTGVDVPLERDDPPVVGTADESEPAPSRQVEAAADVPAPLLVPVRTSPSAEQLTAGRQAVVSALGALLAQRSAAVAAPRPVQAPVPAALATVPVQRTASSGGLAELQLLADGIDLLSGGRS